jgi:DeoR/GlpR family transcriptional regulator of sugar metabolism
MLKTTRQARIRDLVDDRGAVTVGELNEMLGVSEATIRRDLDELDHMGSLLRTHGGAVKLERVDREPPLTERHATMAAQKTRIAQRAVSLIRSGDTVFLGSGTTVEPMAEYLAGIGNLTVISNSLPVVNTLSSASSVDLIVIGGSFRRSELSMIGPAAVEAIMNFRADHVFMGVRAVDVRNGLTGDAIDEAMTDRAILEIGSHAVVLADSTKFGKVSTVFLAPLDAVDLLITDDGLDTATIEAVTTAGCHLIVAES